MKRLPKRILVFCLTLVAALYIFSGTVAYRKFRVDLVHAQSSNQEKMTRIINQSLNLYFDKLRLIVEETALQPAFIPESTISEDGLRYRRSSAEVSKAYLSARGIAKILDSPRNPVDAPEAPRRLRNWQIYKALPETTTSGGLLARQRRMLSRSILKTLPDAHYVFEMDINGDLVFLEPFDIQKNISSFNYEFRDYLQLVKKYRATVISEAYISHDRTRTQVITVATPILDLAGNVAKLFAVSVSADTLREKAFKALKESMELRDGTVFYLIDRHGHVMASSSGKNTYFPSEGRANDEGDQGNLRSTGFFKEIAWLPDVLEKGNVWERGTKSWRPDSVGRDYSGEYVNPNGVQVFGTFHPAAMIGQTALNWGLLIETPKDQLLRSERTLIQVFVGAGVMLVLLLCLLYSFIFKSLRELEAQIDTKEAETGRISAQVAHDIRSPLAALDSAMAEIANLPERKRIMIRGAMNQIRDIANNLLETNNALKTLKKPGPAPSSSGAEPAGIYLLSSLVDSIVTEKRQQFRSKIGLEIDARLDAASYGLFGMIQPTQLKRLLSNLINNAVDALGEKGRVRVDIASDGSEILLKVQDNGKGIPPEILAKLGQQGETHGKPGGSGLGLYHARTTADAWGGRLEIYSELGNGTSITLRLPAARPPAWFVSKLELKPGGAVVVLDDDKGIHQIWNDRFDALQAKENGIDILHYSAPDELRAWVRQNPQKAAVATFLTDYELLGHKETGLAIVEELAICDRAILITSRFEENDILEKCLRLRVRMIPKALAGFVPISIKIRANGMNPPDPVTGPTASDAPPGLRHLDAVLIEDDELVRMAWEDAATEHGKTFLGFQSVADFLCEAAAIDRRTPIYLDVELGKDVRGDQESLRIRDLGFSDVYLATGHVPSAFAALKHLRGIVGKAPPWLKPVS